MGRFLALALVVGLGCGPIEYVNTVTRKADSAVEAARAVDAAKWSPYWWTRATQYLHQARVEAASADFQAANRFGRLAEEAAIKALMIERAQLELRAPIDGMVAAVLKRKGEVVPDGTEVVSIVTARPGYVLAWVHEKQARNIDIGMEAKLQRTDLLGASFYGKVVEISPQVEEYPLRLRPAPDIPVWGRRAVVKLDETVALLPGEVFYVRF